MSLFTLPHELDREVARHLTPHDRLNLRLTHTRFSRSVPPGPIASEALQTRAEKAAQFEILGLYDERFGKNIRDVFTNRVFDLPSRVRPSLPLVLSPSERRRQVLEPIPAFKRVVFAFEHLPEVAQRLAQTQDVGLSLHEELDFLAACRIRARAELGRFQSFFQLSNYERQGKEEIEAVRRWTSSILKARDEPLLAAIGEPLFDDILSNDGEVVVDRVVRDLSDPSADERHTVDLWLEWLAERHDDRNCPFAPPCKDALEEARQSGLIFGLVVRAGLYEFQRKTSPEARKLLIARVIATVDRMANPSSDVPMTGLFSGASFLRAKEQYFDEIYAEADLVPDWRARARELREERPLVGLQMAYAEVFRKAIQLPDVDNG